MFDGPFFYIYKMNFSFPKQEKLKSQRRLEQLMAEGATLKAFPLKVFFLNDATLECHQVACSVPKRNFKLAVTRNRIKRQMKEGYRLHKHLLTNNNGKYFALLFVYIGKEKPLYIQIDSSIRSLLKQLAL